MKRAFKAGDRVQFTRYWLIHHSMRGAPRVPHTQDDVGMILNIVKSIWPNRDGKFARVRWIAGPERADSVVSLKALEPFGTAREMQRYPPPSGTPSRGEGAIGDRDKAKGEE